MTINFKACRETKTGNIITPKCRLSFPNLFTARTPPGSDKEKYSVSMLIPPDADVALLKKAAAACAREKWGDKLPAKMKTPFLDAGDYEYEGYVAGWLLVRASSIQKPGIVRADGSTVTDESEVYPGRWACVSLRPFVYDTNGNRGVSFGLQNVQLLDHDEAIGGRAKAEDEFEPVEDAGADGGAVDSADDIFG